jgi:hypothetical protein
MDLIYIKIYFYHANSNVPKRIFNLSKKKTQINLLYEFVCNILNSLT